MLTTIAAACGLFAGTNIDDIVVLTLFFLAVQRGALRAGQVVAGQYLGVGALVAVSLLAALGLTVVPDRWIGLLGVIPLALGLRGFVRWFRTRTRGDDGSGPAPGGLLGVAGVTLANGADNIAVYTPVFRTRPAAEVVVTVVVFAVLIAVWCLAGHLLGSRPVVLRAVERVEGWLVPAVFTGLGLVVLSSAGGG